MQGEVPAWLQRHPRRDYIVRAILSYPPWVDRRDLKRIKLEAKRMGRDIDHDIPLSHPYVCGLSVPWNLRTISRASNTAKSNRWNPFQLELFDKSPEQITLQMPV